MLKESKQFEGKVTDLFDYRFKRSRLMLTLVYVSILAVILTFSGGIIRWFFSLLLEGRFRRLETAVVMGLDRPMPPHMMEYLRADLSQVTLLVNGLLLILAGLLSYWLAGYTLKPIQESYHRQRRFLNDISHELRTPLAILQTGLENELRDPDFFRLHPSLKSHLEEVQRMSQLVDGSLVLSRIDNQERLTNTFKVVDLVEVVRVTVDRMQSLAERVQVNLKFENDKQQDNLFLIRTPGEGLLERVIENLVSNAIKYNNSGGLVEVLVNQQGNQAVLKVRDNGIGIKEDEQDKVFERFYRAEKSRSRQAGGCGLGLSIVKSIVNTSGGTVSLKSRLNLGTEVTVYLPIHKAS